MAACKGRLKKVDAAAIRRNRNYQSSTGVLGFGAVSSSDPRKVSIADSITRFTKVANQEIKIDGVLKRNLLFGSARVAAERAEELTDQECDY